MYNQSMKLVVLLVVIILAYVIWWLWRVTKSMAQIERVVKSMAGGYDKNFNEVYDRLKEIEHKLDIDK
jgi:Na+-transporting methylmalonyl-CoA/oxaloacetate decarboxylase gamma subunit